MTMTMMRFTRRSLLLSFLVSLATAEALAAPAALLFEDEFNRGIPGWTAVQPPGTYIDGPMRWQYDIVTGAFLEQSNIYTDAAAASPSATAVMLVNDAVAGANFTYRARLIAGDDDAFGLIFGYQNPTNFYRVTFTRQVRTVPGFPWNGWSVDRKLDNVATNLFGDGTPTHVPSFVNRQYVPFDVTISVTGANLLTLTIMDDPEGVPTEYRLVEAQPLPGPVAGQVGLIQWGQSGTLLRGFRVVNPQLEPIALVGNPNALPGWTPVVPPRGNGAGLDAGSGNGGVPIWSLALGANGAYGTLHENSDSLGGNTADGQVDFAAASLVNGDVTWSNYVYTARIIPADDDGHGILLRYQDELNFYRIALRAQANVTAGVKRGLSIQKVVAGVWEEVFSETAPTFIPPSNVPYDITAVMVGNRLQVQVVGNPLGAAQTYSYGPFEIQGDTLGTGKVGVFSWAMSRLEVDFVRVFSIDGVPLQISSAYGSPEPAVGLHGFQPGASVTATVPSPVEEIPGVRRTVTGWTGTGSVPAAGTTGQVSFTINEVSSLLWNWHTDLRLNVQAGTGGQVNGATADWLPEGSAGTLTAVPNVGHLFVGWSGDVASLNPILDFVMTRPMALTARFEADSDQDGLPDAWESTNLGSLAGGPGDDPDLDGKTNLEEYRNGTNPKFAEALLVSDGLTSRWVNEQRDPALPGQLVVRDFGHGFRGVWENSNDYREAVDGTFIGAEFTVPGVSFEGPRILIRTNVWEPGWNDFTAQATFSVGDNDGNCVYFRYQDELNWYRVTICGENNNLGWRAPFGVTVQKRSQGVFSELTNDPTIATDPTDLSFYKRVRITVTATGADFEVRVTGWNTFVEPPDWDIAGEHVLTFNDPDHASGRFGVGTWGQSGGGPATATNPVDTGVLIEDVVVTVAGQEVFREDWENAPLAAQLPAGWENPAADGGTGSWFVTAHGSILQTSNFGTTTSGTVIQPKADAEGTILLAPSLASSQYALELGCHPFDDDGIGFVYDYQDAANFSRVLFVMEATANGRVPRGVNVSRKVAGAWSDVFVADTSFVYRSGSPFGVTFANNNGDYRLTARQFDDPNVVQTWSWSGPVAGVNNRFGLTCWGETDAHFLYARAFSLPTDVPAGDLKINSIAIDGGSLQLEIVNPGGGAYAVEHTPSLAPGSWTEVASGLTGTEWTTPLPSAAGTGFYRLRRQP